MQGAPGLAGARVLISNVSSASACLASSIPSSIHPTGGPDSNVILFPKLPRRARCEPQAAVRASADVGGAQHSPPRWEERAGPITVDLVHLFFPVRAL